MFFHKYVRLEIQLQSYSISTSPTIEMCIRDRGNDVASRVKLFSRTHSLHSILLDYFFRAESVERINLHTEAFGNTGDVYKRHEQLLLERGQWPQPHPESPNPVVG